MMGRSRQTCSFREEAEGESFRSAPPKVGPERRAEISVGRTVAPVTEH